MGRPRKTVEAPATPAPQTEEERLAEIDAALIKSQAIEKKARREIAEKIRGKNLDELCDIFVRHFNREWAFADPEKDREKFLYHSTAARECMAEMMKKVLRVRGYYITHETGIMQYNYRPASGVHGGEKRGLVKLWEDYFLAGDYRKCKEIENKLRLSDKDYRRHLLDVLREGILGKE